MTQPPVLNMIIIGVLVALFASIHHLRASTRLRLWILGWLFILLHFGLLLWQPSHAPYDELADALSASLLLLCGISFLLSASVLDLAGWRLRVAAIAVAPALAFAWLAAFGVKTFSIYLLLDILGHVVGLVLLWYFYNSRLRVAIAGTAVLIVCWHWILYLILIGQPGSAVSVILMEFFGLHALLFRADYNRRSAGVLTTSLGLLCWAAVFPVAMTLAVRWPHVAVNPELWNVPKFFVAFGMIVTLLEDEIAHAGKQRAQYQLLFEQNPMPMWIFSRATEQILEVNAAAVAEYGYPRESFLSMKMDKLLSAGHSTTRFAPDWSKLNGGRRHEGPWRLRKQDGTDTLVETSAHGVQFAGIEAGLILAQDVTERLKLHEQLLHQANHDPLTGLPNRLLLEDRMKVALAAAARHGSKTAVFCIDLDRFKRINDTLGHAAGDSCLREIATRLKQRLRTIDTAARTGGEEFMVILDEIKNVADIERVAEDLLLAISAPHMFEGTRIPLSASLGIAIYPDDARQPADLWHMSDAAMYRAKQAGGSRFCFFSRVVERSA